MGNIFRFARIQVDPFSFNRIEAFISGHLCIELDRCEGVSLQVTI